MLGANRQYPNTSVLDDFSSGAQTYPRARHIAYPPQPTTTRGLVMTRHHRTPTTDSLIRRLKTLIGQTMAEMERRHGLPPPDGSSHRGTAARRRRRAQARDEL